MSDGDTGGTPNNGKLDNDEEEEEADGDDKDCALLVI
jgi:hypothetical protein